MTPFLSTYDTVFKCARYRFQERTVCVCSTRDAEAGDGNRMCDADAGDRMVRE